MHELVLYILVVAPRQTAWPPENTQIGEGRLSINGRPAAIMNILSYNPAHDGAIAYLKSGHLLVSIEAEKNSNWRYSPLSSRDVFDALGELDEIPDVICRGGWWARDHYEYLHGPHVQYRGVSKSDVIIDRRRLFGRPVYHFSSSHERAHVLCAFGMSSLPKGAPCYALIWEGEIWACPDLMDA
jgi:predicted NodU family carbamoyl transferase